MINPIAHNVAIRLLIAHSNRTGLTWSRYVYKIKVLEKEVRLMTDVWMGRRVYKGTEQYYIRGVVEDIRRTRLWSYFIEKEYSKQFVKHKTKFQLERDANEHGKMQLLL